MPSPPGRVAAVGRGVTGWNVGDRIGFADVPLAHASHVLVPATHAIRLPDWLSESDAAAILLQGLTADYLVHDLLPISAGMHIAVLAAAGSVGKLLSAMLIQRGALVLAVASSAEKRALCLELGVHAVTPYENWPAKAREWGAGGCDVVFDSLGSTVPQSLDVLRPGGRVVLYGMAGGDIPVIDPATLLPRSIGIIGADLWTWLSSPAERQRRADRLFSALDNGIIKLPVIKPYALSAGIEAHRQLEQRDFSGKILLVP